MAHTSKARGLVRLMRPSHWLKNALVLVPIAFSGRLGDSAGVLRAAAAFISFSLAASLVYVMNDLADAERDRLHPTKRRRPIASGEVSPSEAGVLAMTLAAASVAVDRAGGGGLASLLVLVSYVTLNVAYSRGLKSVPLLDVTILASGYVLRVLYGAIACGVTVSGWLYLTVLAGSFCLGLGKRRGELDAAGTGSRAALLGYTRDFLDKNMYVCLGLAACFYALWAREGAGRLWTVPLAMLCLMRYSLDVERGGDGDPMGVIASDPALLALGAVWAVFAVASAYLPGVSS